MAQAQNAEKFSLDTRWLNLKGLGQDLPKDATGVLVKTKINGQEKEILLPFARDTFLRKGSDVAQGKSTILVIRDGGQAMSLAQLDFQGLPKDAEILEATLQFKAQYVEKNGGKGTINCSRILESWQEDARGTTPNYEPAPFATLKMDKVEQKAVISVPGFAGAVKAWHDGSWPNNGFLITFGGGAMQINLPSRESYASVPGYTIGGEKNGSLLLVPNVPLLEHVVLKPQDILAAHPVLVLPARQSKTPVGSPAKLCVYEVALEGDNETIDTNGERKLLGSVPLVSLLGENERTLLPDIGKTAQNWIKEPGKRRGVLLTVEGANTNGEAFVKVANSAIKKARLQLDLPIYTPTSLFDLPVKPKAGVYTQLKDGHFYYDGQRLRLWGVVGSPETKRLVNMGFNAERLWKPSWKMFYTKESAKRGEFAEFVTNRNAAVNKDDLLPGMGDAPAKLDQADKHVAELKEQGVFIMFAALCDSIDCRLLLDDDSFIAGGDDWKEWKESAKDVGPGMANRYLYVDRRLQEIKKRHAKNLLTHVNPHTGKAYGEEEAIAIYEVFNENGFVWNVLSNGFDKWPPYFLKELQEKWNIWLKNKYATDVALRKAWGELKPGESLGKVAPAPDIKRRGDYPVQRANDFVQFLAELSGGFHKEFRDYCRSLFPQGVGVNVVPFSFDTQFRPNLTWSYLESLGDVNCFGMYFWNLNSALDKPPTGYVIDSATVENKPSVLYETNMGRPSPYRSEYPLKLAAMAAHQDWDGVFWHYWGSDGQSDAGDLGYLTAVMMPPERAHYWTAVHHETDPVMDFAMMMAGRIFQRGLLAKAAKPDVIEAGKQAVFSYQNFAGVDLAQSTFHNGSTLRFSPDKDMALAMNGGPMPLPVRLEQAIASGGQVTWDWPNGRLIIDAPEAKAYVGKVNGMFRFSDGITIGDISTPWICWVMVSEDGSPLAGDKPAKRVLVGGVFDARNSGFQFNYNVKGGPTEQANAVSDKGHEPVLVMPVEYTVWFPTKLGGSVKSYDFALRETSSLAISDNNQVTAKGATPFVRLLSIDQRGAAAKLPLDAATPIALQDWTAKATGGQAVSAGNSTAPVLPELPWDSNYLDAHKALRDSIYTFTNISPENAGDAAKKTIIISGIQLPSLWNLLANISLDFSSDKITGAEVTFLQPPSLGEIQKDFTKRLGEPKEVKLGAQFENSRLHWTRDQAPRDVLVTESQGIMKILITP